MTDRAPPSHDSAARHARVTDLFLQACELHGTSRFRFLDEACGPDATLRREVEALLAADERAEAGTALDHPAAIPSELDSADATSASADPTGAFFGSDVPPRRGGLTTWILLAGTVVALGWLAPWPAGGRGPTHHAGPDALQRADEERRAGHLDEAEALLRATLREQIATNGDADPGTHATALRLAQLIEARGQPKTADTLRHAADAIAGKDGR